MHQSLAEVEIGEEALDPRLPIRRSTTAGSNGHRSVHIPSATAAQTTSCPTEIEQLSGSPTVVLGDLNAKHNDWNSTENTHGRFLKRWAMQ